MRFNEPNTISVCLCAICKRNITHQHVLSHSVIYHTVRIPYLVQITTRPHLKGSDWISCHAYNLPRLLHTSAFAMDFTYIHKVHSYNVACKSGSIKQYSTEHQYRSYLYRSELILHEAAFYIFFTAKREKSNEPNNMTAVTMPFVEKCSSWTSLPRSSTWQRYILTQASTAATKIVICSLSLNELLCNSA